MAKKPTTPKPGFDESYVREILADMPAGLTLDQFRTRCQLDLNARYAAEVEEARRRYFAKGNDNDPTKL